VPVVPNGGCVTCNATLADRAIDSNAPVQLVYRRCSGKRP